MGVRINVSDAFASSKGSSTRNYAVGDITYEIDEASWKDYTRRSLETKMVLWINRLTSVRCFIVRNLTADLVDGVIFGWFVSLLFDCDATLEEELPRMAIQTYSSSVHNNRLNWTNILDYLSQNDYLKGDGKWSVEGLAGGNTAELYILIIALVHKMGTGWDLPSNLSIVMVKTEYLLHKQQKSVAIEYLITGDEEAFNLANAVDDLRIADPFHDYSQEAMACPEDTIDILLATDNVEKLDQVATHMKAFLNKHLRKIEVEIEAFYEELACGEPIILALSVLSDMWVPLTSYISGPESTDDCVSNIRVAFNIMDSLDIPRKGIKAPAMANGDKRFILKTIYNIFNKYKHVQ